MTLLTETGKKKTAAKKEKVPVPTLERLATYLRFLNDLEASRVEAISSAEVERQTGINAAQFRKDLSYFGDFGKPGVGYNVPELQARIARILKIDREQRIILVGAGNLGSALVGYPGLKEHRFNLVAVFDNNYGKIGRPLWELEILDVQRIQEVNAKLKARIAILAVPAGAAQGVAETLVAAGVLAILNFAPVMLRVPRNVFVRNVSFLQELAVLSYHISGDALPDLLSGATLPVSDHPDGNDALALEAVPAAATSDSSQPTKSQRNQAAGLPGGATTQPRQKQRDAVSPSSRDVKIVEAASDSPRARNGR